MRTSTAAAPAAERSTNSAAIANTSTSTRCFRCGVVSATVVVILAFTLWKPLINTALHQKAHVAHSNTESREVFWGVAVKLAERRPLTGVGPGRFPTEAAPLLSNNAAAGALEHPVTHNSYLEILSEEGIPALLLFIAYLVTTWLLLRRVQARAMLERDQDLKRLATALQAALVIGIVAATFLSEELTSPLWLLGGLAVVLARSGAAEAPAPGPGEEPARGLGRAIPAPLR